MSLVDVHPSTVSELNDGPTAAVSAACNAGGSTLASVVSTANMVARCGASIAAPLAIAPTEKPSRSISTSLATVSVVKIAWAAPDASARSGPRLATIGPTAEPATSIGNGTPISPVWHTST